MPNWNAKPAILLRETYREDGKVKNRTLANLSQWSPEKLAALAAALDSARNDGPAGGEAVGTVPHGHVQAVLGTARRLGRECSRRHERQVGSAGIGYCGGPRTVAMHGPLRVPPFSWSSAAGEVSHRW